MKYNELLVYEPGNQYPKAGDVAPFASLPAWWRRFIFQVLNGRELQVYLYIVMMADAENAIAYPLVESMRQHMGLRSDTQIFEALSNLEALGFIRRRRLKLPNRTSELPRNIYQRAAPEFTLLVLLKRGRVETGGRRGDKAIDEFLDAGYCPTPAPIDPKGRTAIPKDVAPGLKRLLGAEYEEYAFAPDGFKRERLMRLLQDRLQERRRKGGEKYANLEPAPRDRQREVARIREKAIAAAGGVATTISSQEDLLLDDDSIPF